VLRETFHQPLHARAVVRPVEEHVRPAGDEFHSPGPADAPQTASHAHGGKAFGQWARVLRGRDRRRCVHRLVFAQEREKKVVVGGVRRADREADARPFGGRPRVGHIPPDAKERRAGPLGGAFDDSHRLRPLRLADDRNARLDDTGLLSGDGFERPAQLVRVVDADGGENAHVRPKDVRRIEPPAQPHLNDRQVHGFIGEMAKGERGEDLEEGRRVAGRAHPVDVGLRVGDERAEGLGRDVVAPDADPLADVHEMRRGVEPRLETALERQRVQDRRRRALAFRPRDVDASEPPLRRTERP